MKEDTRNSDNSSHIHNTVPHALQAATWLEQSSPCLGSAVKSTHHEDDWVAVQELKVSYHFMGM